MRAIARYAMPAVAALAVGWSIPVAFGQPPAKEGSGKQPAKEGSGQPAAKAGASQPEAKSEEFLPVEKILTKAVSNISVRYNLNDQQRRLTDQIMRRDVYKFLREHRDQVWPVLRDLMRWQMEGKVPPGEAAKRLATATEPLLEQATKAIFDGNEEWRNCLTASQKRLHDWDMDEMQKTFERVLDNLEDWKAGSPKEGGLFPPPPDISKQPPRPSKPPPGLPKPQIATFDSGLFEALVKKFIQENGLGAAQAQAARSILDEFKEKADTYYKSKKKEFIQVWADERQANEQGDLEARREAYTAKKELLKPINAMADGLELRLVTLLNSEQLEIYRERHGDKKVEEGTQKTSKAEAPSKRRKSKKQKTDKPKSRTEDETSGSKKKSDKSR